MERGNRDMLLQLSKATILGLVDGIIAVFEGKNKYNEAYINADPGVLPHQVVHILPFKFSMYLQRYRENINYTFSIK